MKALLLITGIVFTLLACKKRPLEPDIPGISNKSYTIEGTMYDEGGKTPLPNYPLILLAEVQRDFNSNTTEQVASGSTDENGYYKLTYKDNDDYSYLDIGQPSDKLPVYGPFLTKIPTNQNIKRDFSKISNSVVKIKVNSNERLQDMDSLMVYNIDVNVLNDSLYKYEMINASGSIYIYIYILRVMCYIMIHG